MTDERKGLADFARDRSVGDREPRRVDPAPVVASHLLGRNGAGDVAHKLLTRGRQFGRIGADRVDEGSDRLRASRAVRPGKLSLDEREGVRVLLDRGTQEFTGARSAKGVKDLLAANRSCVNERDDNVGIGRASVGQGVVGEGIAHRLALLHDDDARLCEEAGTRCGAEGS